jgi:hypothetical protein
MAQTEDKVAGVSTGDYFVFNVTSQWSSSNSSATAPPYLVELNSTQYYKVMVSSTIGPNVSATNVWHLTNDTEINSIVVMDVESSKMYLMSGFQGFCKPNLGVGDPLYSAMEDSPTINQTISRYYGSDKRDTNVVTFSYAVTDSTNATEGTETLTLYIDKEIGIVIERNVYTEFPDQTGSEIWTLTETNLWTATAAQSELPLPLPVIIAIVVVIVVAIVAVFLLKKRKKGKKRF